MGHAKKTGYGFRIEIQDIKLSAKLGVSLKERARRQTILCSLVIEFPAPPKAQKTDQAKDSICYEKICHELRAMAREREYRMLERMSYDLLSFLRGQYPDFRFSLTLRKSSPPVKKLCAAVFYAAGDCGLENSQLLSADPS